MNELSNIPPGCATEDIDPTEIVRHCDQCKHVFELRRLIKIDPRKLTGTKTFMKPSYYCTNCFEKTKKGLAVPGSTAPAAAKGQKEKQCRSLLNSRN